jgi:hypothetical protein
LDLIGPGGDLDCRASDFHLIAGRQFATREEYGHALRRIGTRGSAGPLAGTDVGVTLAALIGGVRGEGLTGLAAAPIATAPNTASHARILLAENDGFKAAAEKLFRAGPVAGSEGRHAVAPKTGRGAETGVRTTARNKERFAGRGC